MQDTITLADNGIHSIFSRDIVTLSPYDVQIIEEPDWVGDTQIANSRRMENVTDKNIVRIIGELPGQHIVKYVRRAEGWNTLFDGMAIDQKQIL